LPCVTRSALTPFYRGAARRRTPGEPGNSKEDFMGVGVSILLIAAGAILTWAVTATVSGVSIHTVGVILLIVGIIGLALSMVFWTSWGGVGGPRRRTYIDDAPPY
jgi:hypothetical protein